jgi:uncharacterized protein
MTRSASAPAEHTTRAMPARIVSIRRYPVKGLSPEPLEQVALTAGQGLPQDRRFALARAGTRFDPERPEWLPKTDFVTLLRDEKLARLRTRFDSPSGALTIEQGGRVVLRAPITEPAGRRLADAFFAEFLDGTLNGPPRLVEAPGHTFPNARRRPNATTDKYVSLINLASIRELERVVQVPLDPIRFRANLYLDGAPAWTELGWVGSELTVGVARLRAVSPTVRCAATTVNPATAERDLNIPAALQRAFGHIHLGVYAEVVQGGEVAQGDPVTPPD